MRYTTIIDISEYPQLYRSASVRLVYLHLVLKSGYHDDDRDLCGVSVRRLANDCGLTVAATRHALALLEKYAMIKRQGSMLLIRKWVVEKAITPRARTQAQARQKEARELEEIDRARRDKQLRAEEKRREDLRASGKTPFMVYYEGLLVKAKEGDPEAIRLVEVHKNTYQAHAAELAKETPARAAAESKEPPARAAELAMETPPRAAAGHK